MRLYLIRHGETVLNKTERFQHDEVPLSDLGIAQASLLGRRMAQVPLERIVSSNLRRAAMTACIVAAHTGTPLTWEPAFRERKVGELTGKPHEKAMEFFTNVDYVPPGGESVAVFRSRVCRVFEALVKDEGDRGRHIAVITHGLVCRAFAAIYLGRSEEEIAVRAWPNTSVTIADYDGGWQPVTLADAAHLEGLDSSPAHSTGA